MNSNPSPPLSVAQFHTIRDIVRKGFGISFSDGDRYLVESRLADRLADLGMDSFDKYIEYLGRMERQELSRIIDVLTNNETYFFREDYQLKSFTDEILPMLHKKNADRRTLTVWSAGCSSGEEAYTIAMLLRDSPLFKDWQLRVFGSDVSGRMLGRARAGEYGKSAFRTTSPAIRLKHFTPKGNNWEVNEDIKGMCNFGKLNILDDNAICVIGQFDVIFCRNVLMYFDTASRTQGLANLFTRLNEGGFLLLGHTETLFNLSTEFEQHHLRDSLVYRKPENHYG